MNMSHKNGLTVYYLLKYRAILYVWKYTICSEKLTLYKKKKLLFSKIVTTIRRMT